MNKACRGTLPILQQAFSSSNSARAMMIGHPDVMESNKENYPPGFGGLKPKTFCSQPKSQRVLGPLRSRENVAPARPELPSWECDLKKAKLLIVEGNIGVGKTTLTKKLADKLGYRIFLEPTTENPYLGMSVLPHGLYTV